MCTLLIKRYICMCRWRMNGFLSILSGKGYISSRYDQRLCLYSEMMEVKPEKVLMVCHIISIFWPDVHSINNMHTWICARLFCCGHWETSQIHCGGVYFPWHQKHLGATLPDDHKTKKEPPSLSFQFKTQKMGPKYFLSFVCLYHTINRVEGYGEELWMLLPNFSLVAVTYLIYVIVPQVPVKAACRYVYMHLCMPILFGLNAISICKQELVWVH